MRFVDRDTVAHRYRIDHGIVAGTQYSNHSFERDHTESRVESRIGLRNNLVALGWLADLWTMHLHGVTLFGPQRNS